MPNDDTNAALLFNEIIAANKVGKGEARLEEFLNTPETDFLEFKNPTMKNSQTIDENATRQLWANEACGLANAGGGVVIWGIDSRENRVTKYDEAEKLKPVPDPRLLATRLRRWLADSVTPPIQFVVCESIVRPDGTGYVACHVPESVIKPHGLVSNGRISWRSGGRTMPAPMHVQRMLWLPQRGTHVAISGDVEDLSSDTRALIKVGLLLRNCGNASPREMMVRLQFNAGHVMEVATANNWQLARQADKTVELKLLEPLHPGTQTERVLIAIQMPMRAIFTASCMRNEACTDGFQLTCFVFSQDSPVGRASAHLQKPETRQQEMSWVFPEVFTEEHWGSFG